MNGAPPVSLIVAINSLNRLKLLYRGSSCGPLVMKLIASRSLNRAIQSLPYSTRQRYPIPETFLQFLDWVWTPEQSTRRRQSSTIWSEVFETNARFCSATTRSLREECEVLLWHDVVNNSITPHRSNMFKPLSSWLESSKVWIVVNILYCHRERAEDIFELLKKSRVSTIHVVNDCYPTGRSRTLSWFSVFVRSIKKLLWNSKL